jgi:uncharacterized protein
MVAQLTAGLLGRPSLMPIPGLALRAAFGEVAGLLLTGQRGVPQRLLDLGFSFRFPEAETVLKDLLG